MDSFSFRFCLLILFFLGNGGGGTTDAAAILPEDSANAFNRSMNYEQLLFHPRCGKNVHVIDGGRTLRKKGVGSFQYTVGFTNRHLYDNEILQVKVNRLCSGTNFIGVISTPPEDVTIIEDMTLYENGWGFYNDQIYVNGIPKTRSDGILLQDIMVDETIGVMKDESGDLHLFIDGTNVGVAASNLPSRVYGYFQFWVVGQRATIDSSYAS